MKERINWKTALGVTAIGFVLVVGGIAVGDFTKAAVSGALISLGTTFALVAVIIVLQRLIVYRVAEAATAAATSAVEHETADLRERIVNLENLDAGQARELERRRNEANTRVEQLLDGELTVASVGDLFIDALEDRLFTPDRFRVRTSADPNCHALYLLPLRDDNGTAVLWFDFEPFELDPQPMVLSSGKTVPVPIGRDTTVIWTNDNTAAQIAAELQAGLERANQPPYNFSLAYALRHLVTSIQKMRAAREAEAGSALRLEGSSLELLINHYWAFTSYGLEGLYATHAYPYFSGGFDHTGRYRGPRLLVPNSEMQWVDGFAEAQQWMVDREGCSLEETDHA
jgi:hypothetical protein